jgi:hypothetical protein
MVVTGGTGGTGGAGGTIGGGGVVGPMDDISIDFYLNLYSE